jgi:hypothetical protein
MASFWLIGAIVSAAAAIPMYFSAGTGERRFVTKQPTRAGGLSVRVRLRWRMAKCVSSYQHFIPAHIGLMWESEDGESPAEVTKGGCASVVTRKMKRNAQGVAAWRLLV